MATDPFDISLHDHELHEEVVLCAQLIIAASESSGPLDQAQIDAILQGNDEH